MDQITSEEKVSENESENKSEKSEKISEKQTPIPTPNPSDTENGEHFWLISIFQNILNF